MDISKNLNLWDIAAGIILIKAGGVLNEIDLKKHENIEIISSTPNINQKLLEII